MSQCSICGTKVEQLTEVYDLPTGVWIEPDAPGARLILRTDPWLVFTVQPELDWAGASPKRQASLRMHEAVRALHDLPTVAHRHAPVGELLAWAWRPRDRRQLVLGAPFDRRQVLRAIRPALEAGEDRVLLTLSGPVASTDRRGVVAQGHVLNVDGVGWRAHLMTLTDGNDVGDDPYPATMRELRT